MKLDQGIDKICDAMCDMDYKRIFVIIGGDAIAWGLPPLWNDLAEHGRQKSLPSQPDSQDQELIM
eukprot:659968-Amphidinium_carterae.9